MIFMTYLGMMYDPLCQITGLGLNLQSGLWARAVCLTCWIGRRSRETIGSLMRLDGLYAAMSKQQQLQPDAPALTQAA
jgi:hypothetical protein